MQKTVDSKSALGAIVTDSALPGFCTVQAFVNALKLGADHSLLTLHPLQGSLIGVGCALDAVRLNCLQRSFIGLLRDVMMVQPGPDTIAI